MFYAQIDSNNICYAVTQTSGEIIQADMISIPAYDESLLGMKYNTETKVFEPPE